jgi:ATP-binding cassette subfamily B protein
LAQQIRDRVRRWLIILRLLPYAGTGLLTGAVLLNVVLGVMPIAFIVWMSIMLSRLRAEPDAATPGLWSTVGIAFVLAVAALAIQQVLGSFQTALGELVSRRVDGHCIQRLMATSLRHAPIATLEREGVLDGLSDVRSAFDRVMPTPGAAAAGTLALLARYAQLAGAVVLIGAVLHPATAVVVAVTALVIRFGQRGSLSRFADSWAAFAAGRRRVQYLRALSIGPEAAKEIRVLGLRPWLTERLGAQVRSYLDQLWALRRRLLLWPFVGFATVGLLGAGLVLGDLARAAAGGQLTLLQFAIAIQALLIPVRFGTYFPECDVQTQFGAQAYRALIEFEQVAASAQVAAGRGAPASTGPDRSARPAEIGAPRHAIRFEGVDFGYPGASRPVFQGLDLELAAGKSTAIVGLNGAGKTTLVKLLARFYDPTSGRITVDGQDLREVDARAWQGQLAIIFQDFVRYELTAAENIGLGAGSGSGLGASSGAPPRPPDEVVLLAAAQRAGALGVIESLPAGLATPLFSRYDGGRDLSGGQWQRIALSRAFFATARGASVLVLDEPTAQLDVRAEVEFFDRFLTSTHGLTSVVISHRFSTVRRADHIVVLEHGRVVEQGTHDGLVELDGRYAHMFRLQAQRFADPDLVR